MEKLRKDDAKDNIKKYENQLVLDELSERTIKKYVVDVEQWLNDMPDIINKTSIISYKNNLAKLYKPTTVNSKIISVNKFLKWMGCDELKIKTKRIQHTILCLIPRNITQTVPCQQVTEYQAIGQYRIVIEILIEFYPRLYR